MDFNGDGRNDVISGSYRPGHLYLFEQQGDGTYASGQTIKDKDDQPIEVGSASHVFATDWDNDRDLDLVVGNIRGELYFVRNEGKAGKNAFAAPEQLSAGGEQIRIAGGDSGPVLADWDGDDLLDLIVGGGDGSVVLFRNVGDKSQPKLADGRELIVGSNKKDGSCCGSRTKVCVTDFNGDGQLDLLVGDFTYAQQTPVLTPQQQAAAAAAQVEYQKVAKRYTEAVQKSDLPQLTREYRQLFSSRSATAEGNAEREKKQKELMAQIQEIQKELQPYIEEMRKISLKRPISRGKTQGFVWVFLRRPTVADKAAASGG
ncbi:MAG: FG-GAP-like repeat-containing protein [Pirellulales bacterium]